MSAALFAMSGAFAKKVVFKVDMTGKTISANGVHIAGNFKNVNGDNTDENPNQWNWDPSKNAMTNGGSGNIYSIMMDLAGGFVYEYKIINDNTWGPGEEGIPAESQVGGGNSNRWTWVSTGTDTVEMAAVTFGGNAPAGMQLIRLKVDMALVSAVSPNGVHVAGSFQGWKENTTRMANYSGDGKFESTVYQVLVYAAAGEQKYKFINGNSWSNAESVPAECKVDNDGNRGVTVGTSPIVSMVCYSKCGVCLVVPKFYITFVADVESICGVDSVDVAGGLLDGSWGAGNRMTNVPNTNKWIGSQLGIDSGSLVQFKYRYYKGGVQTWEQIATPSGNRELKITSDTILPVNCFGFFTACNPRPATQTITFKTDISEEVPNGNVYLVVDYLGGKKGAIRMTPNASNPAQFETTVQGVCNGSIIYYFMNGDSSIDANAESFKDTADRACTKPNGVGGFAREYVRTSGNPVTLANIFNSCKTISTSVIENNLLSSNMRVFPNPSSSYTVVEFNDNSNKHNVTVMDITGRVVKTINNYEFNALRIERDGLTSGTYFINVVNSNNQTATIKLMVD